MMGARVVEEARLWIGTPYRHQAALRGVGCDCAGMVLGMARSLGLTDFRPLPWPRQPSADDLERNLLLAGCRPLQALCAGALVQFRLPGALAHVGVLAGDNVVHSWAAAGGVVEMRLAENWKKRVVAGWHLPGIDGGD